jgi:diguanylate cyclase (GGDEF)-like protein
VTRIPPQAEARTPSHIWALAALAVLIVTGTLFFAYRETDELAEARQAKLLSNAILQHGRALSRELRAQSIWGDAYRNTAVSPDRDWMREFYGEYLSTLLGYDEIYVVDGANQVLFAFKDGKPIEMPGFTADRGKLADMVGLVRGTVPSDPGRVTVTPVRLGDQTIEHRATADVRLAADGPASVVVATIVPDTAVDLDPTRPFPLLVASYKLDRSFLSELGTRFGFADLDWLDGERRPGFLSAPVRSDQGRVIGDLTWRNDLPGRELLRKVAGGFTVALVLLIAIGFLAGRGLRQQTVALLANRAREAALARTDFLTSLPNRLALSEAFADAVEAALRIRSVLGVVSIDLDGFKDLNDSHGHHMGDQALFEVAGRLRLGFPECFVARTGGDEFVVLVPADDAEAVDAIANRICAELRAPFRLVEGIVTPLSCSVGYSVAPLHGTSEDDLMRRSDLALFSAKKTARGAAVPFDAGLEASIIRRRTLEACFRRAVERGTVGVAYQPILARDGRRMVGIEALARWTDPDLGPISPAEFIPIAEETGLIVRLGEQVLRQAIRDASAWPELTVAVNVSAQQIHRSDIVGTIRQVLAETGFPPERLEIELTESVLIADEDRADRQIRALRAIGIRVALDDFGTGYSSLLYLRRFGFDKLKIDRQFVRDTESAADARTMIESIVAMSRNLGLVVTAEGVERDEQHAFLAAVGCDQLQGFLFSAPVTADRINERFRMLKQTA